MRLSPYDLRPYQYERASTYLIQKPDLLVEQSYQDLAQTVSDFGDIKDEVSFVGIHEKIHRLKRKWAHYFKENITS